MKAAKPDDIQVGMWVTICCEQDLEHITDEAALASCREQVNLGMTLEYWDTEAAALRDIREGYQPGVVHNDHAIAEINGRLRELGEPL